MTFFFSNFCSVELFHLFLDGFFPLYIFVIHLYANCKQTLIIWVESIYMVIKKSDFEWAEEIPGILFWIKS